MELQPYNKTVTYQGATIKVKFHSIHVERIKEELNRYGRTQYTESLRTFEINGKTYPVLACCKRGRTGKFNVSYLFEGRRFPDSERKIIEDIIARYGL